MVCVCVFICGHLHWQEKRRRGSYENRTEWTNLIWTILTNTILEMVQKVVQPKKYHNKVQNKSWKSINSVHALTRAAPLFFKSSQIHAIINNPHLSDSKSHCTLNKDPSADCLTYLHRVLLHKKRLKLGWSQTENGWMTIKVSEKLTV